MLSIEGGRVMRDLFETSRAYLEMPQPVTDEMEEPGLQLDKIILQIMDDLRESLKVKSKVLHAKQSLVVNAGKIKKRASQVIDRVVEA